jgi:hypothetical protein
MPLFDWVVLVLCTVGFFGTLLGVAIHAALDEYFPVDEEPK